MPTKYTVYCMLKEIAVSVPQKEEMPVQECNIYNAKQSD